MFANLVLADEINRAPAKVQSALLEVMAERQVSIGGTTYPLPRPFVVLATQNPIENEGVYPLPEAQRDRFLLKVVVGHPSMAEEMEIVRRMSVARPYAEQVLSLEQLVGLQELVDDVFVHHAVAEYAVRLVMATREPERWGLAEIAPLLAYGASPRGSLGLVQAARALAVLRGRDYVMPVDISDLAVDVLAHRLVLTYEALADEVSAVTIVERVVADDRGAPGQPGAGERPRDGVRLSRDRVRRPHRCRPPRWPRRRRRGRCSSTSSRRLDGLLQGDHLGFLPGPGSEPAEARAYAPGDDVRRIDWAVTARTSTRPRPRRRRRARARDDPAGRPHRAR